MKKILHTILSTLAVVAYSPNDHCAKVIKSHLKHNDNKMPVELITDEQKIRAIRFIFETADDDNPVCLESYMMEQFRQDVSDIFKASVNNLIDGDSGLVDINRLRSPFDTYIGALDDFIKGAFKHSVQISLTFLNPGLNERRTVYSSLEKIARAKKKQKRVLVHSIDVLLPDELGGKLEIDLSTKPNNKLS